MRKVQRLELHIFTMFMLYQNNMQKTICPAYTKVAVKLQNKQYVKLSFSIEGDKTNETKARNEIILQNTFKNQVNGKRCRRSICVFSKNVIVL